MAGNIQRIQDLPMQIGRFSYFPDCDTILFMIRKERQQQNMIDTILLDFDGTLMNTNDLIIESWQHTFSILEGKEGDHDDIIATFGEPLHDSMERMFPEVDTDEAVKIYRDYHRDHFCDRIEMFPGMAELLKEIRRRDYKTGLVTSRLARTTGLGLKKYGLEKYFDAVVTMEECTRHKPDPQPVELTLAKLHSSAQNSLLLGDTMYDILCAKNAGVISVLVGWAMAVSEKEINGPDGPDYVIEEASDLLSILEKH